MYMMNKYVVEVLSSPYIHLYEKTERKQSRESLVLYKIKEFFPSKSMQIPRNGFN